MLTLRRFAAGARRNEIAIPLSSPPSHPRQLLLRLRLRLRPTRTLLLRRPLRIVDAVAERISAAQPLSRSPWMLRRQRRRTQRPLPLILLRTRPLSRKAAAKTTSAARSLRS